MAPPKLTPMLKQYLEIKEEYGEALLFYRMGDFYEMFFEDAERASRLLDITLTSRNKNDDNPVPMCGVPYRAVQGYIAKLIDKGYKVAICDQVEDPATAKGLVKREVVRVITPGMIIEDDLLDGKTNNFVLAVSRHQARFGLASLDISTGTFRLAETDRVDTLIEEARRIAPREILIPESLEEDLATRLSAIVADQDISGVDISVAQDKFRRFRLKNPGQLPRPLYQISDLFALTCQISSQISGQGIGELAAPGGV